MSPVKIPKPEPEGEASLAFQLKATKNTGWVRELKFHPMRTWRFDFAWETEMVAGEST